jgi:hypothetical protein
MDFTDSTYEEVSEYIDGLLSIDSEKLDSEAVRNQHIFASINRVYIQKSRKLYSMINKQDKLELSRYRHYNGKETKEHYREEPLTESLLKTDIPLYMNVDPLVIEMRSMVKECERIVKYLEDAKGSLRSRGFDIKNAIDYRKLMLGM